MLFFSSAALAKKKPRTPERDLLKAQIFFEEGKFAEARDLLTGLVEKFPDRGLYWFNLANAYFELEKYDDAVRCYRKVTELKSTLSPAAVLYAGRALRRAQKPEKAASAFLALDEERLPHHLKMAILEEKEEVRQDLVRRALESYQRGEYREAVDRAQLSLKMSDDLQAEELLGLASIRLNDPERAKSAFSKLLETQSTGSRRDDAQFFLDEIRPESVRKTWYLGVLGSLGYLDNVFNDPTSGPPVGAAALDIDLVGGKKLVSSPTFSFDLSNSLFWEETLGNVAGRFVSDVAQGKAKYFALPWVLQAAPAVSVQYIGQSPSQFRAGASASFIRYFGSHSASLNYSFLGNVALATELNYLAGTSQIVELNAALESGTWTIIPFYRLSVDAIGDLVTPTITLPLANVAHGPGIEAQWTPNAPWQLFLWTWVSFKHFSTKALPDNIYRDDTFINASGKLVRKLTRSVSAYVTLDLNFNSSSLGASSLNDRNFSQVAARFGASWDIVM